jgi:uncharacterized protein YneF (UPF0154 family)
MFDPMNTALTIMGMAVLLPLCVIAGIYVGHSITIKSQTNETKTKNEL